MDLKKYFTFVGRINRAKYIFIPLALGIMTIPISFMAQITDSSTLLILYYLLSILVYIVQICLTVQRLHDIERPGFHYWLLLIPFYGFYLALILLLKKGTDGPNEYGEDPLAIVYE